MTRRPPTLRLLLALLILLAPGAVRAFTVSGSVKNEAGQGMANVDLDFVDVCTGESLFLVNDKTAADGSFSISVAGGTYDVRFTPPAGSASAGKERPDVVVSANTNLGVNTLPNGRLVSGTVRNGSGAGIAGVDLKWVNASTGDRVYVGKDVTSASGAYSMRVPPGTWDVEYRPPSGTTYVTGRRRGLVVQSDVSGLTDTLATGFQLTGLVKDKQNNALRNVDLNVYDGCSGEKVPTANDNTDAAGRFTTYLPAGTYSVQHNPPRCKGLVPDRKTGVRVDRNTDLGTTTLPAGVTVTGRVVDGALQPVADAELKFFDANNGQRQATNFDTTNASGSYSIFVPTGTYNINVEPPAGRTLLVSRLSGVAVAGATTLGDTVLAPGFALSGRTIAPDGQGVLSVDVDVVHSVTRDTVRIAHDNSRADGTFTVIVPAGSAWDVLYTPPSCSPLAPDDQRQVAVSGATTLPTLRLVTGATASGVVRNPQGAPVAGVDLDFLAPGTRNKSFTPRDTTDGVGSYATMVKPARYDIEYIPPAGLALRPARRPNTALLADTPLPDTTLPAGFLVSGFVRNNQSGAPVASVEVEFFAPGAAAPLFTPHNDSGADGFYNVSVDAGTWDLRYTPPAATGLAPRWRRGVAVNAATPLADTLLLPLTVPVVGAISPAAGSAAGGQAVTVTGSGFQPDATVRIGGITARSVVVVSGSSITAVAPPHPPGRFEVQVVNPGEQIGTLAAAFTFNEPANPARLTVRRVGSDIVLSWTATGQASYTVFRNATPTGFTDASIAATTSTLTWTDAGAGTAAAGSARFYVVE